jgi:hypothetical protein
MRTSVLPLRVFQWCASKACQPEPCPSVSAPRCAVIFGRSTGARAVLLFFGAVLLALGLGQTAFGQYWDGGNGDWFGPWNVGQPPGSIGSGYSTNWSCGFCYPGSGSDVQIGTIYNPSQIAPAPLTAASGTVYLNSAGSAIYPSVTIGSLELADGAPGGLQVNPGGSLTTGALTIGTLASTMFPGPGTLSIFGGDPGLGSSVVRHC